MYGGPKFPFVDERVPLTVYINNQSNGFTQNNGDIFNGAIPTYTHAREISSTDLNGDSISDVIVSNHGFDDEPFAGQNNAILITENNTLTEIKGTSTSHNYRGFTHSQDIADIDNDGDIDIVYVDITGEDVGNDQKVRVLLNDGNGDFSVRHFISVGDGQWTSVKLVDLDNDGNQDMVLGGLDSNSESIVVWGTGKGNFE